MSQNNNRWITAVTLQKESTGPNARRWAGETDFLRKLRAIQEHERTTYTPTDRTQPLPFARNETMNMSLYTNRAVGQWHQGYTDVWIEQYHFQPPQYFIDRVNEYVREHSLKVATTGEQAPTSAASPKSPARAQEERKTTADRSAARQNTPTSRASAQPAAKQQKLRLLVRLLEIDQYEVQCGEQEVEVERGVDTEATLLDKFGIDYEETVGMRLGWFVASGEYQSREILPGVQARSLEYALQPGSYAHHLWVQW